MCIGVYVHVSFTRHRQKLCTCACVHMCACAHAQVLTCTFSRVRKPLLTHGQHARTWAARSIGPPFPPPEARPPPGMQSGARRSANKFRPKRVQCIAKGPSDKVKATRTKQLQREGGSGWISATLT